MNYFTVKVVAFDLLDLLSGDDSCSGHSSLEQHRSDFRDALRIFVETDCRQCHRWKWIGKKFLDNQLTSVEKLLVLVNLWAVFTFVRVVFKKTENLILIFNTKPLIKLI